MPLAICDGSDVVLLFMLKNGTSLVSLIPLGKTGIENASLNVAILPQHLWIRPTRFQMLANSSQSFCWQLAHAQTQRRCVACFHHRSKGRI